MSAVERKTLSDGKDTPLETFSGDRIDERPEGSNRSGNEALRDLISARMSRRSLLGRSLAAGAVAFFGGAMPVAAQRGRGLGGTLPPQAQGRGAPGSMLGFNPVATSMADAIIVPDGYVAEVLVPWGQPIFSSGPAWEKDASNTAAEQEQQIGMHHDGMHYFPLGPGPLGNYHGLLVLNHEYVDRTLLYPDGDAVMTLDKVDKALAAHGVTVIEIAMLNGKWQAVDGQYNRRITGKTPMAFSGPVSANHPMLQANNPPQGTLNNCGHGVTPWGTYLACEENWNGYFGTEDGDWEANELEDRYGVSAGGFGYRWHEADPRFDVALNSNELNRFGWIVEVDPFDPNSTPVKRTALGRIKHEGGTYAEARGRAVIYSGDDENGDYFYKFVSAAPWRAMRAEGRSPLDEGALYVAKFHHDGTGEWLPLVFGEGPLTVANGWVDQADVLIRTRQAADAVGATQLDRPEWCAVHPKTEEAFLTLTNGAGWGAPGGPNPRVPNPYGHIVKIGHQGGDHTRTDFFWDIFVLAGDPAYDAAVALDDTNIFGSPDGIWVDPDGRLWIQTDISNSSQNRVDRGYDNIGNNQMLVADTNTSEIRRFLVGPRGCEITGVITTPDQQTMFINVQHPGESTTFWGAPTPADPRAVSNWPDFEPAGRPRAATVVIRKIGGGKVGT